MALATLECEYSDSTNVKSHKRPCEPVSNFDNESCDTGKNPHKKLKPGQANIKKYFEQQSHKEVVIGNDPDNSEVPDKEHDEKNHPKVSS